MRPNGKLKLMAVEYIVPGLGANPPGVSEAPSVLGMEMPSSFRRSVGTSSTPGSGAPIRQEYLRIGVRTWSARKGTTEKRVVWRVSARQAFVFCDRNTPWGP